VSASTVPLEEQGAMFLSTSHCVKYTLPTVTPPNTSTSPSLLLVLDNPDQSTITVGP